MGSLILNLEGLGIGALALLFVGDYTNDRLVGRFGKVIRKNDFLLVASLAIWRFRTSGFIEHVHALVIFGCLENEAITGTLHIGTVNNGNLVAHLEGFATRRINDLDAILHCAIELLAFNLLGRGRFCVGCRGIILLGRPRRGIIVATASEKRKRSSKSQGMGKFHSNLKYLNFRFTIYKIRWGKNTRNISHLSIFMGMADAFNNSAFEKRIKKHVIGKMHRFTAVAPLGFEDTLAQELYFIGVETDDLHVASDGKVEFTAKITEAWKAVAYSRIANRVLMEIASFKAENFGQLEKHAAEIPWELFLPTGESEDRSTTSDKSAGIVLHTTCKHSRLYHSDAIEERILKIISEKISLGNGLKTASQQHLYIHFLDDRCTIWLDLAGEELYKRGHERFVAEAPLKETIAAAMLFEASKQTTNHQPQTSIIDPMAGSGTFSLEAAYIANGLIPGKCRDFALKHQPAFKETTWRYIVEGKFAKQGEPPKETESCIFIMTSDIAERPVEIIRHNIENSPLKDIFANSKNQVAVKINPQLKDFFDYTLEYFINTSGSLAQSSRKITDNILILLNPPYGKRLDFDAPKLYSNVGKKLSEWSKEAEVRGINLIVAILAPKDDTRNGAKYTCTANLLRACSALNPANNKAAKLIETSHGGFSLNVFIAKI